MRDGLIHVTARVVFVRTKEQAVKRTVEWILFVVLAGLAVSGWISAPLALALGIVFALFLDNPMPQASQKGAKWLLQASVVGLGFGMNLAAVWAAGRIGLGFTIATIFGTLLLGLLLGRLLRIDPQTSLLVSSGTAICGGSAIAAVGAVIGADKKALSVSLCTIFVLNAIALFIFPSIGHALGMDQRRFGLWSAIAIHDTSSVVGAAAKYGDEALSLATTVKLSRALWIFPLALGLAVGRGKKAGGVVFPWFILFFLCAAAARSFLPQGEWFYDRAEHAAKLLLILTLFLIGSGLSKEAIRSVGVRPMVQGILLWMVVSVCGLLVVNALAP